MKMTFKIYFGEGNQALLETDTVGHLFQYLLNHLDYYHDIVEIERIM